MKFSLSPYLFEFYGFGIRYYALMYLLGLLCCFVWLTKLKKINPSLVADYCLNAFIVVIVGGRIGYILFYQPEWIFRSPLEVFKIWHGGMSFHGGLLTLIIYTIYFLKQRRFSFFDFSDAIAVPGMLAICLGRIGNFLNGELWGRATNAPWCFYVQGLDGCRHPAQLYQAVSDFIIFLLLLIISRFSNKPRIITAFFFIGYSVSRSVNEIFWREPSWIFIGLSAGTWLSMPMMGAGIAILARKR